MRKTRWLFAGSILPGIALTLGCGPKETRIDLTAFNEQGQASQHYASFRKAYYRLGGSGTPELVLESRQPSVVDPTQTVSQVVYIKCFWSPLPGTTFVESSQINARVQYAMLTPPTGIRYDGGGFLSYKRNHRTGRLVGKIESGSLAPRFRMGDAVEPFRTARLTGTFVADENPREVIEAVQMLKAQFGTPVEP